MMNKLEPEMRDKWIEALESDKFEQGIAQLKRDNKYCCLGVFCEINNIPQYSDDFMSGYVAISKYISDKMINEFIDMNDVKQMSFKEIAQWIRENM